MNESTTGEDIPMSKRISPRKCRHDLAERETACADGLCPICLNASIAAEREKWKSAEDLTRDNGKLHGELAKALREIQQLSSQLAEYIRGSNEVTDENIDLEQQLAAAQAAILACVVHMEHDESPDTFDNDLYDRCRTVSNQREALAAAIAAAQKPLMEALHRLAMRVLQSDFYLEAKQETDDAIVLANAKELK